MNACLRRNGGARKRRGEEGGFTLIELMVVVLIIGILVAIALPTFLGARTRAQDSAAKAVLKNALTGGKAYFTDSGSYDGFDAAGNPEGEEVGIRWAYPSAPATTGAATINLASGDYIVMTVRSESNTYFCMMSNEGSVGIPQVRGGVESDGATLADLKCVVPTW